MSSCDSLPLPAGLAEGRCEHSTEEATGGTGLGSETWLSFKGRLQFFLPGQLMSFPPPWRWLTSHSSGPQTHRSFRTHIPTSAHTQPVEIQLLAMHWGHRFTHVRTPAFMLMDALAGCTCDPETGHTRKLSLKPRISARTGCCCEAQMVLAFGRGSDCPRIKGGLWLSQLPNASWHFAGGPRDAGELGALVTGLVAGTQCPDGQLCLCGLLPGPEWSHLQLLQSRPGECSHVQAKSWQPGTALDWP